MKGYLRHITYDTGADTLEIVVVVNDAAKMGARPKWLRAGWPVEVKPGEPIAPAQTLNPFQALRARVNRIVRPPQ